MTPARLAEELAAGERLAVIDEVQRLPELPNEVHRLIEEPDIRFLLTGSSARKPGLGNRGQSGIDWRVVFMFAVDIEWRLIGESLYSTHSQHKLKNKIRPETALVGSTRQQVRSNEEAVSGVRVRMRGTLVEREQGSTWPAFR